MERNTKEPSQGYKYEPMPESMIDNVQEWAARERIAKIEQGYIKDIVAIRDKGFTVNSIEDLKVLTPEYVRTQIEHTKKTRLQNSQFIPSTIRKSEEKEFDKLEKELISIVSNIQQLMKSYPLRIHIGSNPNEVYLNANDVDKFVRDACAVNIPEDIRLYYGELQKVCEAWFNFCLWAEANGFEKPGTEIAQKMIPEKIQFGTSSIPNEDESAIRMTPEIMFSLFHSGLIIRKS